MNRNKRSDIRGTNKLQPTEKFGTWTNGGSVFVVSLREDQYQRVRRAEVTPRILDYSFVLVF